MGVLDLHNECPPMNYGLKEAQEVAIGLGIGEEATSAALRATADCLVALASMDDTVNKIMAGWGAAMGSTDASDLKALAKELQALYSGCFDALSPSVDRINLAVQKYRDLEAYADSALKAGRGVNYEQALEELGGSFGKLVNSRIERLRALKVRIKVLQQMQELGSQLLASSNYPDFFLLFMQPFRDMSFAVNDLYSEIVRGAIVSHRVMLKVCKLPGEDITAESIKDFLQPVAAGTTKGNEKVKAAYT